MLWVFVIVIKIISYKVEVLFFLICYVVFVIYVSDKLLGLLVFIMIKIVSFWIDIENVSKDFNIEIINYFYGYRVGF